MILTHVIHSIPFGFQLSTDVGVFVSFLKANSCEEEKETLRAAISRCTPTIFVENCKHRRRRRRMRTKYIV